MIELTESWQDVFDKAIRVKKRARKYIDEKGGGDQRGERAEQPPPDTLVPPNVPTADEQRGFPEEGRSNQRAQGATFRERTKEDSQEAAVEAVRKMTSSNSSLESSAKSAHGGKPGGDWDPTYDGFTPRDRGSRSQTALPHDQGGVGRGRTQAERNLEDTP